MARAHLDGLGGLSNFHLEIGAQHHIRVQVALIDDHHLEALRLDSDFIRANLKVGEQAGAPAIDPSGELYLLCYQTIHSYHR